MLKMKKNESKQKLVAIAKQKLKQVCDFLLSDEFHVFNVRSVYKLLLYNPKLSSISDIETEINTVLFIEFLNEPQIDDLLQDYLNYLFLYNTSPNHEEKFVFEDDVINYFIGIIEQYYDELLVNDNSYEAIRRFFNYLMEICMSSYDDKIFLQYTHTPKAKKIKSFRFSFALSILTDKLSKELQFDFKPYNPAFLLKKESYIKSLKRYYQNGFIYLLGEYQFNQFYIPPILLSNQRSRYHTELVISADRNRISRIRSRWKDIFNDAELIYIIGGPGYGKSLFLRNIINNYTQLNIRNSDDYLIIYCDLKTFYSGEYTKKTMVDFFLESMISITGNDKITKEMIQFYLHIGRCIVLLDALDEVPKDERVTLHKKIVVFFLECNPNNKVCITSRDRGFIPEKNIKVLEINALHRYDIEDYIDKMISLKKFKIEDKQIFMKQTQVLTNKGFLNNFLVLSLLVNIYKSEKELPENKIDLYKKCFEYIAKKREEEKSKIGYNWDKISPIMKDSTFIKLSTLAAPNNKDISRAEIESLLLMLFKTKFCDEATAESAISEFLDFCSQRTELFVPSSGDDKYKFFHRSFFEYFYSRYIHQQAEIKTMYKLMTEFDIDSEIFELTVALVKEDNEEKYQKLLDYIFYIAEEEFKAFQNKFTAFSILTLAMQVVDDVYYINQYYKLVLSYKQIVANKPIRDLNQNMISQWIEKAIKLDHSNRLKEFIEEYEIFCVATLLQCIANYKENNFEEDVIIEEHTDIAEKNNINYFRNFDVGSNLPFYLKIYGAYNNFYNLLEKYMQKRFNEREFDNVVSRKKKILLRKGYKNYYKLSEAEKKRILEIIEHFTI